MIKNLHNKKGFTLLELLIVVAIIAVLIAIAIPMFSNALNKSKEATCLANRRSLKAELAVQAMLGERDFAEGVETSLTDSEAKLYTCPSGGKITYIYKDGTFTVNCDIHNDSTTSSGSGAATYTIADKMSNVTAIMKDAISKYKLAAVIDSNANTDAVKYAEEQLKAQNIDVKALGAKSWRYDSTSNANSFYWTDEDLNSYNTGDKIPVMRYNLSTGTYTVWYTTVSKNKDYNIINPNVGNTMYSECAKYPTDQQTYDNAVKWLKDAQSK